MRSLFFLSLIFFNISFAPLLMAEDTSSRQADNTQIDQASDTGTIQDDRAMTPEEMIEILIAAADESKVLPHSVLLKYKGIELTCIYDVRHDRMRIITPVAARGDITAEQFEKAMEANFHTALDARYALNKGILYAAFIHPLSPLTRPELESALHQTATLAATFGEGYSSGFLTFRGGGNPL